MLSDEAISNYQRLYKAHYGEAISREEACRQGLKLIRFLEIIRRESSKAEFAQMAVRVEEEQNRRGAHTPKG